MAGNSLLEDDGAAANGEKDCGGRMEKDVEASMGKMEGRISVEEEPISKMEGRSKMEEGSISEMKGNGKMEEGSIGEVEEAWIGEVEGSSKAEEASIGEMEGISKVKEIPIGVMDESVTEEDRAAREAAAATKIQAGFRGFNVRRRKPLMHLRKIASVRWELGVLQAKAGDPKYIEQMCADVMECRKMTEGIMALLLRLDSLQGVHPVVRDIRKSVNREVVQFQEFIDSVVVGAPTSPSHETRSTPHVGRSNAISHLKDWLKMTFAKASVGAHSHHKGWSIRS